MANLLGDVPLLPNAFAPDVLADEALGFEHINGTVRVTFAVAKMVEAAPPSDTQLVVVGRLIMGPDAAHRLAVGLFDYLKQRNLVSDPASAGQTAQ